MNLPPPPRSNGVGSLVFDWAKNHKIVSAAAAFILVAALVSALGGPTDAGGRDRAGTQNQSVPSASSTPSTSPSPEDEPEPVIPKVNAPKVVGMRLEAARSRISGKGLDVAIEKRFSKEPAGTVLRQSVRGGTRVEQGTSITLYVAKSLPSVPSVAGMRAAAAKQRLRQAGFEVAVQLQESSSVAAGVVISSMPGVGSEVRPGARITLVVAKAPPPPPPSTPSCHPSYQGACLDPNASDYDCAGGSGDGPKYTGYVRVVGYDEYGLDSDGDGAGCES